LTHNCKQTNTHPNLFHIFPKNFAPGRKWRRLSSDFDFISISTSIFMCRLIAFIDLTAQQQGVDAIEGRMRSRWRWRCRHCLCVKKTQSKCCCYCFFRHIVVSHRQLHHHYHVYPLLGVLTFQIYCERCSQVFALRDLSAVWIVLRPGILNV